MWWKLVLLGIVTAGLIFCVIPIRTHAVLIDPASPPPATTWTLWSMVSNMYIAPGTIALIGMIIAVAGYISFRIVSNA